MSTANDDYDSPWKDAVERYFPEFMAFFFPLAHAAIDWTKGYDFLDQELQAVTQDAALGRRYVDKLVRVTLLIGEDAWILIHIEVQGTRETAFPERIFVYNYRLFDRYRRPVASLAILADDTADWKPSSFRFDALGCSHILNFPIVKLLDYAGRETDLLQEENVFALVTVAHLQTRATRNDMAARYAAKWRLIRLLYERGWDRQRIIDLFAVIDWMMRLPEDLNREMWRELGALEERTHMRYVTSVERIGIEKGLQQGRAEGKAEMFEQLLRVRFGVLSPEIEGRVRKASSEQLDKWSRRVFDARDLNDVFATDTKH